MIYTALACMAVVASASSSYTSSSSSGLDRNPDIGYQSGKVELGDGEAGSIYWTGVDTYLDAAVGAADCSNGTNYAGVAVRLNFNTGGGATAWLTNGPDQAQPAETALLFGGQVWDDILTISDTTQFYKMDRCSESEVYLNLEGICGSATGCVSTSDLRAHMTLFTGPQSSLQMFPDLDQATRDPTNAYVSGVTEEEFTEWMLFPVTHLWPDDHPEIQTVDNNYFWLEEGPQGVDMFGISQWVTWDASLGEAGSNIGLYTTVDGSLELEFDVSFGLCFSFIADPISVMAGASYSVNQSDFGDIYCDGGCWPQSDCSAPMDPETGSVEAVQYIQQDAPTDATGVYVTTFVIDSTTGLTGFDHSICNAWGSECSPASSALPTFLGGVLALFAMIM